MHGTVPVGSAGDKREGARPVSLPRLPGDTPLRDAGDNGDQLRQIDLFRPFYAPGCADAVRAVLTPDAEGRVYSGQGPQCEAFEQEFASLVGCTASQPPLLVNSCTSAITLALHLLGIGPGDWVISTPQTCTATNTPIVNLHANILWADVDRWTGHITQEGVHKALWSHYRAGEPPPKAIVAVDWAGAPCGYEGLRSFGLPIIEDAAHRVFALDGPHGDFVCWSFQHIKHLTTGDGGALLVPDEYYRRAKLLRWYGLDRESGADFRCQQNIVEAGYKFQSNDVAAAIGRENLKHTRAIVEAHRAHAHALGARDFHFDHWFYATHVDAAEDFKAFMKGRHITVSQVHRRNDEHPCFAAYRRHLPNLDKFSETAIGLPCGWWLTWEEMERIRAALQEWRAR